MIDRQIKPAVWWLAFLVFQCVALYIVGNLDPGGFDACERRWYPDTQNAPMAIAGVAVAGSAALALWLRRRHLVAALVAVAFSTLVWVWLLGLDCPPAR